MNTPKQIGESLKSTTTVQDNFYSGFVSANRQYAIKHCFLKEFERKRVLGIEALSERVRRLERAKYWKEKYKNV